MRYNLKETLDRTKISLVGRVCAFIVYLLRNRTEIIEVEGEPYLLRCHLWYRGRILPNIYLHFFFKGDQDRDLHNHPWNATTFVLSGGYSEEYLTRTPGATYAHDYMIKRRVLKAGNVARIGAEHYHRVDLYLKGCWTLFFAGDILQSWGFMDRESRIFVDHKVYGASGGRYPLVDGNDIMKIMKGS